jgi:hypothetical protein
VGEHPTSRRSLEARPGRVALLFTLCALPVACGATSPRDRGVACANAAAGTAPVSSPDDPGMDALADASQVCEDACERGDGASCRVAGDLQDKVSYSESMVEKITLYDKACTLRDAMACAQQERWRKESEEHHRREPSGPPADTAAGDGASRGGAAPSAASSTSSAPGSGASLSVDDMNIDGLVIRKMQCRVTSVGLLGPVLIGGIIASQRPALAACGKADVTLAWTASGGQVTAAQASGVPDAQARCVERVVKQLRGLPDGDCTSEVAAGGMGAAGRSAP